MLVIPLFSYSRSLKQQLLAEGTWITVKNMLYQKWKPPKHIGWLYIKHVMHPEEPLEFQPAQVPEVTLPGYSPRTHCGYLIDFMLVCSVTELVLRKEDIW